VVTIYTRNNCVACNGTKARFKALGLDYNEINVEDNLDIAQQLVDEGWRAMPVIKTENESWSGFKPDLIANLKD
jgi:glutaredoxin-like protein NrdH